MYEYIAGIKSLDNYIPIDKLKDGLRLEVAVNLTDLGKMKVKGDSVPTNEPGFVSPADNFKEIDPDDNVLPTAMD